MRTVPSVTKVALLLLAGCGAGQKAADTEGRKTADAGAPAPVASSPHVEPFVASSVPMATVPPTFQYGSRKAEKRPISSPACHADIAPSASDLAGQVQKLVKSCGEKMRPLGAPQAGTQGQGAPAQILKLKAESGHCYRLYGAAAPSVKNLTVVVTDASGAIAWEGRTNAARLITPEDGALCFKAADDAQIAVSVGSGDGSYAIEIVGD